MNEKKDKETRALDNGRFLFLPRGEGEEGKRKVVIGVGRDRILLTL